MNPVVTYLSKLPKNEQDIAYFFHSLLSGKYQLKAAFKWNIPTYTGTSLICYLNLDKNCGVHLCFMKGYILAESNAILEKKGRKLVASYHINNLEKIPYEALIVIIEQAIALDRSKK